MLGELVGWRTGNAGNMNRETGDGKPDGKPGDMSNEVGHVKSD